MNLPLSRLKPLSFAIALSLSACGGGGSSTPGTGTGTGTTASTVSGVVEAPQGQIAMFEHDQSMLVALTEFIFPGAYAAITGLQPVTGATVELIRVDNTGAQVGAVLATASTSITGNYSLSLPAGVDFSGDLVLRITGNSGSSMSAQVVEQSVDINPISQFILDKFIADGTALNTLAVNEVVALTGRVEAFDLTATSDLGTMLQQLEAEVGQFVDDEITVITAAPGNGAQVAGNWRIVDMALGFHDSDGQNNGTLAADVSNQLVTVSDAGSGNINIAIGAEDGAYTNFNSTPLAAPTIFYETFTNPGGSMTLSGSIDANGNLAIPFPFEEQLQTDPNPTYGWRWAPGIFYGKDTGTGNIKLSLNTDAGVRYLTTDTNGDGINDAINPAAREGDEISLNMALILKEGNGMSTASLTGNYGLVTMEVLLDTTVPEGRGASSVGLVNFDGAGNFSAAPNKLNTREVARSPGIPPNVVLTPSLNVDTFGIPSTAYSVSATGAVSIPLIGIQGYASADSMLVAAISTTTTDNGATPPAVPVIKTADNGLNLLTKLGTGVLPADLANSTYRIQSLTFGNSTNGHQMISSLTTGSTIVFDATGSNATINANDRGIERNSDTAEVTAIVNVPAPAMVIPVTFVGTNGEITMEALDPLAEDITIDGFLSKDKTMLITRLYINDNVNGDQDLGIVIGIKQ